MMESLLGENSLKIVEIKTKNLEYKNLFDKAVVVFEKIKSILKSTMDKMLSNLAYYRENHWWKEESMNVANFNSVVF